VVVERHAEYHNGTNTSELLFRYLVRTGDVCLGRLDYHAEEREFRSSTHSFEANNRERHLTAEAASARAKADAESARFFGPTTSSSSSSGGSEHDNEAAAAEVGVVPTRGWIRSASSTPTQVANLHLNPVGGSLKPTPAGVLATTEATEAAQATVSAGPIGGSGPTTAVAAAVGVASFEDLTIIQRGSDYVVTFEAVPYDLPYRHQTATTTDVEVEYACDFEVTGHDPERGGRLVRRQRGGRRRLERVGSAPQAHRRARSAVRAHARRRFEASV